MEKRLEEIPGGPSLVVLPELWTCSYDNAGLREHALTSPSALEMMTSACADKGFFLAGGSLPWVEPAGELYNRAFFVGDSGEVVGYYDKAHLFPLRRTPVFEAGVGPFFSTSWVSRRRSRFVTTWVSRIRQVPGTSGAELIVIPAEWPGEIDHWETLLRRGQSTRSS